MKRFLAMLLLIAATVQIAAKVEAARNSQGKVITTYTKGNTTEMVIEAPRRLVSGRNVYVGPDDIAVTVDDLLSESKGLYYFSASAPGKDVDISRGDPVYIDRRRDLKTPSILQLKIEENYTFAQKRKAEITAVQGDRAMIDRGTLHEVHERDLYWIYDSSGEYKGLLEVRGIGDLQSSGKLYNPIENRHKRALETQPGDRAVFAGQRKLFALGLVGGFRSSTYERFEERESNFGGGLIWNCMFMDGWGVEVLFGGYKRKFDGGRFDFLPFSQFDSELSERRASFIAPIWLKKNFFFPQLVSPFLAAGVSYFDGSNRYERRQERLGTAQDFTIRDIIKKTSLAPVVGVGLELYPARFIRPRFEARWFLGPKLTTNDDTFDTESLFFSFGFFTAW